MMMWIENLFNANNMRRCFQIHTHLLSVSSMNKTYRKLSQIANDIILTGRTHYCHYIVILGATA